MNPKNSRAKNLWAKWPILALVFAAAACTTAETEEKKEEILTIDIQGHRGCRGLWPENSLKAFEEAIKLGVSTIELDCVPTADGKLLVNHDPWMNHEIAKTPSGKRISVGEDNFYNIYKMSTDSAQRYIFGEFQHPRFPNQQVWSSKLQTLKEATEHVVSFCAAENLEVPKFNIEIKSSARWDNLYHPEPETYAALVMEELKTMDPSISYNIQSFDMRLLKALKAAGYKGKIAALTEDKASSVEGIISSLGFKPDMLSVSYDLMTAQKKTACDTKGIDISVWTVNEVEDFDRMLDLGVHTIITDYPDSLIARLAEQNLAVSH